MKLPERVKVGPFSYAVVCDWEAFGALACDPDTFGECHHKVQTIYLNPRVAGSVLAETLWHEVKHAVYRTVGVEDRKGMTEEQAVNVSAAMELAVLRDNPDLVAFLLAEDQA